MDIQEINSNAEYIADTFGENNQTLKLIEELSELIKELSLDVAYDRGLSNATIMEIADVNLLIAQKLYLSSKDGRKPKEEVKKAIEYKIERTLHRIKIGYYK